MRLTENEAELAYLGLKINLYLKNLRLGDIDMHIDWGEMQEEDLIKLMRKIVKGYDRLSQELEEWIDDAYKN